MESDQGKSFTMNCIETYIKQCQVNNKNYMTLSMEDAQGGEKSIQGHGQSLARATQLGEGGGDLNQQTRTLYNIMFQAIIIQHT